MNYIGPRGSYQPVLHNNSVHLERHPMELANATNRPVTEFVLLGFSSLSPTLRLLLLSFLSTSYACTLLGNLCIVWAVIRDTHLSRLPMYILLGNFSGMEMCYVTCTAPRMLVDLASPPGIISFHDCFLQFYFFFSMGATECLFLSSMALDRYLAICHPLRYPLLMSIQVCSKLAASCWATGLLWFLVPIILMSKLPFCGPNIMDNFFCDPAPLLSLVCTSDPPSGTACFVLSSLIILASFLFIVSSYSTVVRAVLKLPSAAGRRKAFSTCSSHMVVVSIFYGSVMVTYINPASAGGSNKVVSLFYLVVTPLLNPLIYSLRNKEMKAALRRTLLHGR